MQLGFSFTEYIRGRVRVRVWVRVRVRVWGTHRASRDRGFDRSLANDRNSSSSSALFVALTLTLTLFEASTRTLTLTSIASHSSGLVVGGE